MARGKRIMSSPAPIARALSPFLPLLPSTDMVAWMVQRMSKIEESDGSTLLDNTLFTYGSGLGDGSTHQYNDLPIVMAGGGRRVKTGQHIHMAEGTPLANLWLTQAQLMGLKVNEFADSTGVMNDILS